MTPAGIPFGAENNTIVATHLAMATLILTTIVAAIVFIVVILSGRVSIVVATDFVANNTANDSPANDSGWAAICQNGTSDGTCTSADSHTVMPRHVSTGNQPQQQHCCNHTAREFLFCFHGVTSFQRLCFSGLRTIKCV